VLQGSCSGAAAAARYRERPSATGVLDVDNFFEEEHHKSIASKLAHDQSPQTLLTQRPVCLPPSLHLHICVVYKKVLLTRTSSKTQIMRQVQQEAAMQNARLLVEKLNEHCFERCVPKPAASLSKGEETCFTSCMEKYMGAWNTVSKQYVARIQRESQAGAGLQNL
jgi:import inner membrane translocase subunit TIM13